MKKKTTEEMIQREMYLEENENKYVSGIGERVKYPLKDQYLQYIMTECKEIEKEKRDEMKGMKIENMVVEDTIQTESMVRKWVEGLKMERKNKKEEENWSEIWKKWRGYFEKEEKDEKLEKLRESVMAWQEEKKNVEKEIKENRILESIEGKRKGIENQMKKEEYNQLKKENEKKKVREDASKVFMNMKKWKEGGKPQYCLPVMEYDGNGRPKRILCLNITQIMEGNKGISDVLMTIEEVEMIKDQVVMVVSGNIKNKMNIREWRIIPLDNLRSIMNMYGSKLREVIESMIKEKDMYDDGGFTVRWESTSKYKKNVIERCGGENESDIIRCKYVISLEEIKF
jgi:hypothetical protein